MSIFRRTTVCAGLATACALLGIAAPAIGQTTESGEIAISFRLGEPMEAVVRFVTQNDISASLGGDRISAVWTVDGTLHKLDVAACPDEEAVIGSVWLTRRGPDLGMMTALDDAFAQLEAMGVQAPTELVPAGESLARYGLQAVSPDELGYVGVQETGRLATVSVGVQADCHPPPFWQTRGREAEAGETSAVTAGGDRSDTSETVQ